ETGEARRDLGVEDVRDLAAQLAAQQRDVLAAGVHHDPHARVFERLPERRQLRVLAQRVDERDRLGAVVDPFPPARGELDQAQKRAVAALAHELGVERQHPRLGGTPDQLGRAGRRLLVPFRVRAAHGFAPGSRYRTRWFFRPASLETSFPCARIQTTGAEHAAFTDEALRPQKVLRYA